ncbi:sigma-70 family RNA polymerase sigma factor [Blastococcus sp. VKM Ac-2987]|uniref:sigma-70 family RNA polymerase sigma factor n=1 Tax=Blastococcus sp. VKM Ac-2987 TaxID=3004141 RepID=UPI0022ABA846|nr:sigma-70 family RNA polymerase sigma factor [Blastococcus sp. VKM Ac-2987]MCZ2859328.1 sigma-70 family RNA polymerase sigma factor [Blastococcus sp. VKM Ac-2987]
MPHPLDAGRPAGAAACPGPGPLPTPFSRASSVALPPPTRAPVGDAPGGRPEGTAALPPEVVAELAARAGATAAGDVDVWALVHRAQGGDAEAFGRLYDHYVPLVHRYAYHRVGDRATAEDVTSETFVRALRRIDSLSFQGRDVGAWLVTIARNIIRDQVKSSRFRLEVATADMRDADRATDGPEDAVLQHLTNEQLLACVRRLSSEQQECIVLRFLHGLSVSETAEIMGKKDGAVKALQHRAVRRLAGLLPEGLR